jgi:flavin reductase (DIM6/NTAB) family NADH-FMN oxidoreductase RutF
MHVSAKDYRDGMRLLVSGVSVLTTRDGAARGGLTATAVCSLSAHPPRLLACVNRTGRSYPMFTASRILCVNVLAGGHAAVAERFALSGGAAGDDKFAIGDWSNLSTGAPALDGALAAFDCRVAEIVESETHGILIGDVVDIRTCRSGAALVYVEGGFAVLALARA